jgi:AcrR family transcriptional regulator
VTVAIRGRKPSRHGAPRGEQAVRTSLVDAATELFAARGPSNVSIREIADAARVNHGLVHHYFGSKDGLLTAVLDRLASRLADEIGSLDDPTALYVAGGAIERHGRILAHLLLEGRDVADVTTEFAGIRALVLRLRKQGLSHAHARERAAQVAALVLGWHLFGPLLTDAAGLPRSERSRRRVLERALRRLTA